MRAQLLAALRAVLVFTVLVRPAVPAGGDRRRPARLRRRSRRLARRARRPGGRVPADRPGLRGRRVVPPTPVGRRRRLRRHGQQRVQPRARPTPSSSTRSPNESTPTAPRTASPRTSRCRSTRSPPRDPVSTPTSPSPTHGCRPRGLRRPGASPPTTCSHLIEAHTDARVLGFLGEEGVNVLELNLALAEAE